MNEIDANKYFKVFDDGCESFIEDMVDELYEDIINQNKQLQAENKDLKQECDELRSDNSTLLAQGDADAFVISNLNFKIQELQQCLDEIEHILEINKRELEECLSNDIDGQILQLIQQAKEGD